METLSWVRIVINIVYERQYKNVECIYFSRVNDVYTADELQRIVRGGINVVIGETHEILLISLASFSSYCYCHCRRRRRSIQIFFSHLSHEFVFFSCLDDVYSAIMFIFLPSLSAKNAFIFVYLLLLLSIFSSSAPLFVWHPQFN